jgi:membrane protein implicated in regulation of membrane protease activity
MLALYLVCAIVAGGLIVLSAVGGLGHHGIGDGGFDHSADAHSGEFHSGEVHSSPAAEFAEMWLPFRSLRFWTYLAGTFGIVGSLLTLAKVSVEPVTAILAGASGIVMGFIASALVRVMMKSERTFSLDQDDSLGAIGKVTVASRDGMPGKVRVDVRGEILDLLALPEGDAVIEAGDEVVVVGIEGDRARVALKRDVFGE